MTSLDLVDPDRISRFRYGVVTWIDKDSFPFSVATDFLLSEMRGETPIGQTIGT